MPHTPTHELIQKVRVEYRSPKLMELCDRLEKAERDLISFASILASKSVVGEKIQTERNFLIEMTGGEYLSVKNLEDLK